MAELIRRSSSFGKRFVAKNTLLLLCESDDRLLDWFWKKQN